MKKTLTVLLALSLVVSVFAGGSGESKPENQTLLIYSNSASNGRGEWLTEQAAKAGFSITVISIPGGDLANRLLAEKNNKLADLVYGLNPIEFERLKAEKLLEKFEPAWAKDVDMSLGDKKDGFYYPIVVQLALIAYNPKFIPAALAPKDWPDLIKPEYKGKYFIFGLGGGTAKNCLAGILVRYRDPNGQYGISQEGWNVAKQYIQNARYEKQGDDYVGFAISGETPIFMIWSSGLLQFQKERNAQFDYARPQVGVPFITEQVGIIAGSKKAETAKKFVDWFGSAEVQAAWSAKFGTIPVHPAALEKCDPEITAMVKSVKPQNIDWGFVGLNMDKWVEKCELEFVK